MRRRQALPQAGSILMKDRHCRWFFCEYKTWQGHFQHHGALSHGEESRNEPNQPPNQPPMLDSLLQRRGERDTGEEGVRLATFFDPKNR